LAMVLASAGETRRTPSTPSARQNDMPPKPASTPRREISGALSIMVMAQASFAARSMAAMMR
jgi:hypothetical protein